MRAIVTRPFKGKDNASPRCIQYTEGQEIDDPIATTAVNMGRARPLGGQGKVQPANKALPGPADNKGGDRQYEAGEVGGRQLGATDTAADPPAKGPGRTRARQGG